MYRLYLLDKKVSITLYKIANYYNEQFKIVLLKCINNINAPFD